MTKDEIKKALRCCSGNSINDCKDCPYANNSEFSCANGEMYKDALDLITEQEKEIERLKAQQREIDDLKAENKQLKTECALLDDELRIARQDTIDVLNKVKDKSYVNNYCREVVEVEKIDEFIKEIENADKD